MSASSKRSAILKVPGVRAELLPGIHALKAKSSRDKVTLPSVLSAKLDAEYGTYTVEIGIPLEGVVNADVYASPEWVTEASFAQEVFDALGIFPSKK